MDTPWFWRKVNKTDSCWLWTGATGANGYGYVRRVGYANLAHRVSWELAKGPIPNGLLILHICDVRNCVNPSHLRTGTHRDNAMDMVAKGRDVISKIDVRGEKHGASKLTWAKVREIRASSEPGLVLAARFGIAKQTISKVRLGRSWKEQYA